MKPVRVDVCSYSKPIESFNLYRSLKMETNAQVVAPSNFMFGVDEVRTVYRSEDEYYFVASDVARILGYEDTNKMTRMLAEKDVVFDSITTKRTNQHCEHDIVVEAALITESGLYQCIFRSRREEALAFTQWVTEEVIPSIRKYGTYTLGQEVATLRLQLADKDAEIAKKEVRIEGQIKCICNFMETVGALRGVIDAPDFKNKEPLDRYVASQLKDTREWFRGYMKKIVGRTMLLRAEIDKIPMPKSKNMRWEFNGLLDALNEHPHKPRQFTYDDYI